MTSCRLGQFFFFYVWISDFLEKLLGRRRKKKEMVLKVLHAFMVTVQLSWLFVSSAETTMSPSVCFFSALMNVFTTGEENWFN